jgi:hypothetical protein
MSIQKQEFYEGAALHILARTGLVKSLRHVAPFFLLNARLAVLLKYSAKGRSPWAFTFTLDEQTALQRCASVAETAIGLICGSDGVVALPYSSYLSLAGMKNGPVHVACYRDHGQYYEVSGPESTLSRKIPPSAWERILEEPAT